MRVHRMIGHADDLCVCGRTRDEHERGEAGDCWHFVDAALWCDDEGTDDDDADGATEAERVM